MQMLQDIQITLTAEELVRSQRQGRARPELFRDAEEAIAVGHTLWQPRAVFDWFNMDAIRGEDVWVSNPSLANGEAVLHVGPKADLLAGAQRILVGVGTIGGALEKRVHELGAARDALKAYMLDSAGVLALGAVGGAIRCLAEEVAAEQGWGVSPSLSPGSLVGWSLSGQREVCSLLPLELIGVRLNSSCVLVPHKSSSAVIGLGPGYDTVRVGSVCRYCALAKTCWRRREDPT